MKHIRSVGLMGIYDLHIMREVLAGYRQRGRCEGKPGTLSHPNPSLIHPYNGPYPPIIRVNKGLALAIVVREGRVYTT